MHRKITRQSRWNLRRASDKAIPNQAPEIVGEGVETGWRASLVDEGTVRLSSKGESDRITQRSAVQIRPPQHERHCRNAVAFACLPKRQFPECRLRLLTSRFVDSRVRYRGGQFKPRAAAPSPDRDYRLSRRAAMRPAARPRRGAARSPPAERPRTTSS
jgi:hypothetical protein